MTELPRFYTDLAPWWPLISPSEDYLSEATYFRTLLGSVAPGIREVLELGSGGGHNAVHLREQFEMTLVDLSPDMLALSRGINPACDHRCGDMRTVRLDRTFDAVFIHDAIAYMTTEVDLRAAMTTAFVHCRPGGVALLVPDETRETLELGTDHGGSDHPDGRGVRFLAWSWDPDPDDDSVLTVYAFLLRSADGSIRTVHETHQSGLFTVATWTRLLEEVGFIVEVVTEVTDEDRTPRTIFVGRRPEV